MKKHEQKYLWNTISGHSAYLISVLFVIVIINILIVNHSFAEETNHPGYFSEWITVDSSNTSYILNNKYYDPASIKLFDENEILLKPGLDYELNGNKIQFNQNTFSKKIKISYLYLPVKLTDSLQVISPAEVPHIDSLIQSDGTEKVFKRKQKIDRLFERNRLEQSGYITRGIKVGSGRDLSIESGLKLSLEGELARNVEVKALLDDRNLPIQPEGSSRKLDEIDKVYIDVQARNYNGRFGDYQLNFDTGKYGNVNRNLEGGRVKANYTDAEVTVAGAVTRAQFYTQSFSGRDGIQGPYELHGKNGEYPVLVTGGSERVWVDGILRQRGQDEDYIIDYNRGEITFTPSLPITAESRIEIDFEYSPETFPRNLYAVNVKIASPSQRYRAGFILMRESDDAERPIAFDMTSEIRNQLESAGETSGLVAIPAADSLGPGQGDYVKRDTTDTDGNLHYYYAFVEPDEEGRPRGEWSVLFTNLGESNGDYEREYDPILGAYRFNWIGPEAGEWAPVRKIPLPETRNHGIINFAANPEDWINFQVNLGVSDIDKNTLSNLDDKSAGNAQNYQLQLTSPELLFFKSISGKMEYRKENKYWEAITRDKIIEYERYWGLDSTTTRGSEEQIDGRIIFALNSNTTIQSGVANLKSGESDFNSNRIDGIIDHQGNKLRFNSKTEFINSDRGYVYEDNWIRNQENISYKLNHWIPSTYFEYELHEGDRYNNQIQSYSGHKYYRSAGSVAYDGQNDHSGEVGVELRQKDNRIDQDKYEFLYDEQAVKVKYGWNPNELPVRSDIELSQRKKNFASVDSADVTTNLGLLKVGFTPLKGAITGNLQYRLSRTVTKPSALIAYQVPAGEGDYIRIDDEYVYDPEIGDYILRSEPTGESLPTTDLAAAFHVDWSPHRLPDGKGKHDGFGWEDISLETQLEVEEVSSWDKAEEIAFINLSSFQTDSTVTGRLFLRQDIHLFRPNRKFNIRLRYNGEKRLQNLYLSGAEQFAEDSWEIRTRQKISSKFDLESYLEDERLLKNFARRSSGDKFRKDRVKLKLVYHPGKFWRINTEVRGLFDNDLRQEESVNGLGIKPGVIWSVREKGRISADFEALWIESKLASVPYELADGRPKGRNGRGNIRIDYKLSKYFNSRATYTVRLDEGRSPIHLARMEISANF